MLCCPSLFGVITNLVIELRILDNRGFGKELPILLNLLYKIAKIVVMGLGTGTLILDKLNDLLE